MEAVIVDPRLLIEPAARGDVRLDADDGIDAARLTLFVEFDRAVEIAMVRQRKRGHLESRGARDKLGDLREPVEERVVAVGVEVDKGARHGDSILQRVAPVDKSLCVRERRIYTRDTLQTSFINN